MVYYKRLTIVIVIFFVFLIKSVDAEPIKITDIKVYPSNTKVIITWNTNVLANSSVRYGEAFDYPYGFGSFDFVTDHRIELQFNINPNTLYNFFIQSCSTKPFSCNKTSNLRFTTISCGESWRCFNESIMGFVNSSCTWDFDSIRSCKEGCSNGICKEIESIGNGNLYVISSPRNADIYINDELRGVSPELIVNIKPGNYNIEIVKPGFEDFSTIVTIDKGKTTNLISTLNVILTCNETDNGLDYFKKGTATDPFNRFVDKCADKNTLNESYCNKETLLASTLLQTCDEGCSKGICIQSKNCEDNTPEGKCSENENNNSKGKPFFCDDGNLVQKCGTCGCSTGFKCEDDGTCSKSTASTNFNAQVYIIAGIAAVLGAGSVVYIFLFKKKKK